MMKNLRQGGARLAFRARGLIEDRLGPRGAKPYHARPFEPYPKDGLGAVRTFLEPFRRHLSPKVIQIFRN